eukprot:TRINITY_DN90508_c0_g1_i1.p1 TRINITY_DN90508_c0_g1~~TRINITY_DN90508_c0_g1_i1.p1  ORF type:complete len:503 (+),score=63.09 TRINITY_DN90508_c0_g1_i1:78-1511(+)
MKLCLAAAFVRLGADTALGSLVDLVFEARGEAREAWVTEGVEKPYKTITQEFHSQPFPLLPGQMLFTDPDTTVAPHPNDADFAVVAVFGDIAKDGAPGQGLVPASLTEVYDHHWVIDDVTHKNELCPYGPNYIFGIGAESRRTPFTVPKGHGYFVKKDTAWGANVHLLRTDGGDALEGDNPWQAEKECNECYYHPSGSKGSMCTPAKNGTFQCCGDPCFDGSCSCPVKKGVPMEPVSYYLRYNLTYTYDLDALKPVKTGVWSTPHCRTFYGVYHNEEQPEALSSTTFTVDRDGEILFSVGHLHTGGINISTYHNGVLACTSYPTYGTRKGVPGDELGHLVKVSPCYDADKTGKAYQVKRGDEIRIDAYYWVALNDERIAPAPGGSHLNVMAYMYTIYSGVSDHLESVHSVPTLGCLRSIRRYCGKDIAFPDQCVSCTERMKKELRKGGCAGQEASSTCLNGLSALQHLHGGAPDILV